MSGMTSQPSLGALVAAFEKTPLDSGLELKNLTELDEVYTGSYLEQRMLIDFFKLVLGIDSSFICTI